jgi:N6-L-threonylcarbamoyladenine synthase
VVCLIVSGGHTELVLMRDHGDYEILGRTIDDAAGEAFDKVARILDIGYPGGPAIDKAARGGNPNAFNFPRARLDTPFDFSFSGLKTAVLRVAQKYTKTGSLPQVDASPAKSSFRAMPIADIAASFQMAVVDALISKTKAAAEAHNAAEILLAGGVSANTLLRNKMMTDAGRPVRVPPLWLCTDNAAMIGGAAHWRLQAGHLAGYDLDVVANLRLV